MFALVGCTGTTHSVAPTTQPFQYQAPPPVGKYDQTWTTAYAQTTCSDWLNLMDDHEQFVAAADMLSGARDKGDGGSGVASDDLVASFQTSVTGSCEAAPTAHITSIAVYVYLDQRAEFRP